MRLEKRADTPLIPGTGAASGVSLGKELPKAGAAGSAPERPPAIAANKASLQPAHVRAKLETASSAIAGAAARAGELAGGEKSAFLKLQGRLRQAEQTITTLSANDPLALSAEDRRALGASLGRELSALLNALPAALEALRGDGKSAKADDLEQTFSRVLDAVTAKLIEVPILPPALAGKDAKAQLEWLAQVAPSSEEVDLTPDQRLAALYFTDAIAAELKAASKESDPKSVDALASQHKTHRARVSRFMRAATAAAATAAIALPVFLGMAGGGAAGPGGGVSSPIRHPEPRPVVIDHNEVREPTRVRITENIGETQRAFTATRRAIAENTPLEGDARRTVVDTLSSAGFSPDRDTTLEQAIATFQTSVGLNPNGELNGATWTALEGTVILAEGPHAAFSPAQTEGEQSASVRRSEAMLAELNLLPNDRVDGTFDAATTRASREFEQANPGLGRDGAIELEQFRAMARELAGRYSEKPEVVSRPSPNTTPRYGVDIDTIVLHHTASNDTAGDLATLTSPNSGVSAHYLIGRDGTIFQLVPDELQAWHAGESQLRGEPSVNPRSIGIEITNDGSGSTPFTDAQYAALRKLVPHLVAAYDVPIENIVGHKDVAVPVGRKSDPAANFETGRVLAAVERMLDAERLG